MRGKAYGQAARYGYRQGSGRPVAPKRSIATRAMSRAVPKVVMLAVLATQPALTSEVFALDGKKSAEPPVGAVIGPPAAASDARVDVPGRDVSDATVRAALVAQTGALQAAEKSAQATRQAADTAARYAWAAALLSFCGALLAGFVAWRNGWLQTRTVQQMKHADFRQIWIDKLREEMARFIRLAGEADGSRGKSAVLQESLAMIILRMDKDDPDYDELTTVMGRVADRSAAHDQDAAAEALSIFLVVSQRILKREWERTKGDMHATPWGRPFSYVAFWVRARRRAEEKEAVRRQRRNQPRAAPRHIASMWGRDLVWRSRLRPPVDPTAPILRIGRLQLLRTEPRLPASSPEAGAGGNMSEPAG